MTNQEKLQQKLDKMKARYEDERERVRAYEQIVKIYGAYMALLLRALNATKDKPFKLTHTEITEGMNKLETRAVPSEGGFEMYVEEKENKNA